jgi:hypothetical protein
MLDATNMTPQTPQPRESGHTPGFVDTDETLGWLDDDDGKKLEAFEARMKSEGYQQCDGGPDDGYEYQMYGPLLYRRSAKSTGGTPLSVADLVALSQ